MSILKRLAFRQYSNADAFWLMFVGHVLFSGRFLLAFLLAIGFGVLSVIFEAVVEHLSSKGLEGRP